MLVVLKDQDYIEKQRIAGQCVVSCFDILVNLIQEKTKLSCIEISELIENEIIKQNCIPTFKNYKGFPAAVCISINKQLVHGIPSDYRFIEGDVISFDFGATFKGSVADAARTYIYGELKNKNHIHLLNTTKKCLDDAIKSIEVNKRTGVIGNAIYKTAKNNGYSVIENYGGHGIGDNGAPHAEPFISNKSNPQDGIIIQKGLSIAIEPMLVPYNSSTKTKIANDKWTVYTDEIGCHFEDTITIDYDENINIITRK